MATVYPELTKQEASWYKKAFIIEVIQKLRETPGRNDKDAILYHAIQNTKYFSDFLRLTYSPTIRFNILKIPTYRKAKDYGQIHFGHIISNKMLDPLILRQKTGEEAVKHLQFILESLSAADSEALELLIGRDMQCGAEIGSINRAVPGFIPEYPCLLCTPWDDDLARAIQFPAISQIKMDGARANLLIRGKDVSTKSRNGKSFGLDEEFAFVGERLPGTYVLDGEFVVLNLNGKGFVSRKEGNGLLNKIAKGGSSAADRARVVFVAWDVIGLAHFEAATKGTVEYRERLSQLKDVLTKIADPRVRLVETQEVASLTAARAAFDNARERGMEGTILKDYRAVWEDRRSNMQLKLKAEEECELRVVGYEEGLKKNVGKLGAFICESADGLLQVNVGGGYSDKEREEFWNMRDAIVEAGEIMTVRYNEKIKNKKDASKWSLFLPRHVEFRNDKNTANTLAEIK